MKISGKYHENYANDVKEARSVYKMQCPILDTNVDTS